MLVAEKSVKARENSEFIAYLSSAWQPWQSLLKRLAATRYGEAREKLIEAMDEPFQTRLQARLHEAGLQEDPDAERIAGEHIKNELAHEINVALTNSFLDERGLASLLAPKWH